MKSNLLLAILIASIYSCGPKPSEQEKNEAVNKEPSEEEIVNDEPTIFDLAIPGAQGTWAFEKKLEQETVKMIITIKGDSFNSTITHCNAWTRGPKDESAWLDTTKKQTYNQIGKLYVRSNEGLFGMVGGEQENKRLAQYDMLGLLGFGTGQGLRWIDKENCLFWGAPFGRNEKGCCTKLSE